MYYILYQVIQEYTLQVSRGRRQYHLRGGIADHEYDTVAGLCLKEWTEQFWSWILGLSDEANPITSVGPARSWRYMGNQPTQFQRQHMEKYSESVWFEKG